MNFFKNDKSKDIEQIENCNYYFINFISDNKEIDEKWDDFDFKTTVNLEKGDFINFRSYTASISNELFRDYGTKKFIIISKEFIIDDNFIVAGGVVCLKVKPVIGEIEILS